MKCHSKMHRDFATLYIQATLVLMVQRKSEIEIAYQLSELKALLARFEHYFI